jgi:hypothetical protein
VNSLLESVDKTKNSYTAIKKHVLTCKSCLDDGVPFNFDRKNPDRSHLRKIPPGSQDEHLLSAYKRIASFEVTTDILNVLVRTPAKKETVGITAVKNAVNKMTKKKQLTMSINQQNDNNVFWKAARFNFCCQILVRLGLWLPEERGEGEIYDEYYINPIEMAELGLTFDLNQVAFWDEIHIDVVIGAILEDYLTFACGEDGCYQVDGVFVEDTTKVSLIWLNFLRKKN